MSVVREVLAKWSRDGALTQGAALAYYALFSLAPLAVLIVAIVGLAFGEAAAHGQLVARIEGTIGHDAAATLEDMIARASTPRTGIVATAVGLVTMVIGASGMFGQLQSTLNGMWAVPPQTFTWQTLVRRRLLATGMILGLGGLLVLALLSDAAMAALSTWLAADFPVAARIVPPIQTALSFLLTSALFAMLFKWLPETEMHWRDVWLGGAVTAVLFALGGKLVGFYLAHATTTSIYGAAGSLVLVLLWVYYSTQILLLGAEFTEVWSRRRGSRRDLATADSPETPR